MSQYYYLISSLPMLTWGMRPSLSTERFLQLCGRQLNERDCAEVNASSIAGDYGETAQPTRAAWQRFDTGLRNEIARLRAGHRRLEPQKYSRGEYSFDPAVHHLVLTGHRATSPLETERVLDEGRWHFLEQLETGHYFDLDVLIVYALKLQILERWERMRAADKEQLLTQTIAG